MFKRFTSRQKGDTKRLANQPIKLLVSDFQASGTKNFDKIEVQPIMNHMIDRDDARPEIEDMDTNDVDAADDAEDMLVMDDNPDLNDVELNGDLQENAIVPMDDEIGDCARSTGTIIFPVDNISRIKEQIMSPPIIVRDLPWRIMIMPRMNNMDHRAKNLGLFLQCNGISDSTTWSCSATAQLTLQSQRPGVENYSKKISHMFYSKENDWGYSHFMSWLELIDSEKGYVKDDRAIFQADIFADAPHGVSWDSKKHTGYVGLKNQGATCYMNSLLQTLYFTNQLRKAVYKMPTESDDNSKSVALALQRVFYDLQFSDKPVGTKKLTKSFGWEALDSFMQHDVQEFLRVLLDKLENKMKGTCVEGTVPKLFEGKMESFIKCTKVEYASKRSETFYDIQLNIKGKKNIYESFEDYVRTETLEGENKYDAGDYGMQEAEKGVVFQSFPPVLHLHLMRFQYDPVTDCCVKFNDRFEFYEKLDLDHYLQQPGPTPAHYTLHAVLVHSGDNHGGHYVVFINPRGDGKWCKFDDDVVSKCSAQDAIENNYGGLEEELSITMKHCTNAYMLVYIRDSEMNVVLEEVTNSDIPSEVEERLKEDRRIDLIRRKERTESHLYITMHVLLEEHFEGYQGIELVDQLEPENIRIFKLKKSTTIEEVLSLLGETFKCNFDQMRIWPFVSRMNLTCRPTYLDVESELSKTVAEKALNNTSWHIFLELHKLDVGATLPPFDNDCEVLIFLKLYDPKLRKLFYVGHLYMSTDGMLCELFPTLNQMADYPHNTPLIMYEEGRGGTLREIHTINEPIEKFQANELQDGDVFIYQRSDYPDEYPDAIEYIKELMNHVEIVFYDKNIPFDTGFTLEMSLKTPYKKMIEEVAERVGTDKNKIQIFKCQSNSVRDTPGAPVQHSFEGVVKDLIGYPQNKRNIKKLFYQTLAMSLPELENKRPFKVLFVGPKLKDEKEVTLFPNKSGTVADLLEEAKKNIELSKDGSGKLRILELNSCKLAPGPDEAALLDTLPTQKVYRIEEIPLDEVNLSDDEMLIPVAHYHKDIYSNFGTPFLLRIKNREPFSEVKQRVFQKLGISEKEFEKFKFALVVCGQSKYVSDNPDFPIDINVFRYPNSRGVFLQKPWLGLDHANKTPKRNRLNYFEKSIKIYN